MKKIALFLSVILFYSASIFAQATEPVKVEDNPKGPEISFDEKVHDYGTVAYGGNGVCSFEFTNTGHEPLILSKPQSSCGCTVPTWPKEPILPGSSSEIQVTYNTKRVGPINKTVTVRSNAKTNTVVLRITGKVEKNQVQSLPEKTPGEGTPANK